MIKEFVYKVFEVAGTVYSFLCGRATEREIRRQERLQAEYIKYEEIKRRQYDRIRQHYEEQRRELDEQTKEEWLRYQEEELAEYKENNRDTYNAMNKILVEHYEEKRVLYESCKELLQQFRENMKEQQNTYVRYNSLKSTLLMLEEAVYRLEGYLYYLDFYKKDLRNVFEETGDILPGFSFKVTSEMPYLGKIYYIKKEEFVKYEKDVKATNIKLAISKNERDLYNKMGEEEALPFMVTYLRSEVAVAMLSLSKGFLKNSIGSRVGIKAEVEQVEVGRIKLKYYNISNLFLKRKNMENSNRRTPLGSTIFVYVKEYDFLLKRIEVTERLTESLSISSFDTIPVMFKREEMEHFRKELQKNGWEKNDAFWRIGPLYDEGDYRLKGIILQQNVDYAYEALFETKNDYMYLVFNKLCDSDKLLKYDDIFVNSEVTVAALDEKNLGKYISSKPEMFQECEWLYQYLYTEFAEQKKMMDYSPMSVYLKQWSDLTERLIEYHGYGDSVRLNVYEWEYFQFTNILKCTRLFVEVTEALKKFVKKQKEVGRKEFFIEIAEGRLKKRIKCRILEEDGIFEVQVYGHLEQDYFIKNEFIVEIRSKNIPYVDMQHAKAFTLFQQGQNASVEIKKAILNISEMGFEDNGNRIQHFYNVDIINNAKQVEAVQKAFAARQMFLIQGPPGTGKTTVIKELILQQLHRDRNTRILVVSQANVAVDNVLRGIVKIAQKEDIVDVGQIVRCGNEERIADDLMTFSFEGKLEEYQNSLKSVSCDYQELREEWLRIVDEQTNSEIVTECLLKSFQIIGATCVGLENRYYGLGGMKFDLVIIDEAGKALPGELLIPINRAKKVIIIGDHKQLPPVVDISLYRNGGVQYNDIVEEHKQVDFLNRSFFQRLYEDCPQESKCMLNIQFRMPPVIAELVNLFYDGNLETGENCYNKAPMILGNHLIFIDMANISDYREELIEHQNGSKGSPHNIKELEVAVSIVRKLRKYYKGRIVIITPYKKQKNLLQEELQKDGHINVWVNTIDAFQGDEEDVVIYCTTRSKQKTKYFSDAARLNVAFSRSRNTLILVGSSKYLTSYSTKHILHKVYNYIKKNARIIDYDQWIDENLDLQYNETYAFTAKSDSKDTNKSFPKLNLSEQKRERECCIACGRELEANEKSLCMKCMLSFERYTCSCCGKEMKFPYIQKFIEKKEHPEICTDCCYVKCDDCGEEIVARKKDYKYSMSRIGRYICKSCYQSKEVIGFKTDCQECGNEIILTKNELEYYEFKNFNMPKYCKHCRAERKKIAYSFQCECCKKDIHLTKLQVDRLKNRKNEMPKVCDDCRNKKIVVGKCSCGKDIVVSYQHTVLVEKGKRKQWKHCEECRKKDAHRWYCKYCKKRYYQTQGDVDDFGDEWDMRRWQTRYLVSCPECRKKEYYKRPDKNGWT